MLEGFHPGCLRFCSMHTLNLGIMFSSNGASLKLGFAYSRYSACVAKFPNLENWKDC